MSKARLLADLMADEQISIAEVSGEASSSDFNVNKSGYNNQLSLNKKLGDLEDETILKLGV
tara:strand:+ start:1859 stop:2041 length:183 start_codon:yes stop_codon:yes gene_type:complete